MPGLVCPAGDEHYFQFSVAPILGGKGLVGSVTHARKLPVAFSLAKLSTARPLADVFALALERAQLVEGLRVALGVREEFLSLASVIWRLPCCEEGRNG